MNQVLLTGSTGFLGRSFLTIPGCEVSTLPRHDPTGQKFDLYSKDYHFQKSADHLLHFAAGFTVRGEESAGHSTHLQLTESFSFLEKFSRKNPGAHIIYPSSGGTIYASKSEREPFTERDPIEGSNVYSLSKISHEGFLFHLATTTDVRVTVLRISNPYGTLLPTDRKQGLIGVAINCLLSSKPFHIFSALDTVRDFMYIQDLKRAVELVLNDKNNNEKFRVFNLASGRGCQIGETLELIQSVFGRKLELIEEQPSAKMIPWSVLDIKKFQQSYDWSPKTELKNGLLAMKGLI